MARKKQPPKAWRPLTILDTAGIGSKPGARGPGRETRVRQIEILKLFDEAVLRDGDLPSLPRRLADQLYATNPKEFKSPGAAAMRIRRALQAREQEQAYYRKVRAGRLGTLQTIFDQED